MSRSSWFKIIFDDYVIHFDPGYSGFFENQNIPENELIDDANFIFISHYHKDHLQTFVLNKIKNANTIIVCPQSCEDKVDFPVMVVKPDENYQLSNIHFWAIQAYNTEMGHSVRKLHQRGDFVGYVVQLGDKRIYFAGDTDFIPEMSFLGQIDIAFLPIGGTYVMDVEEAVMAAKTIKSPIVIPMHHADKSMEFFKTELTKWNLSQVIILNVGDFISID